MSDSVQTVKYVILGTGQLGLAVMDALASSGERIAMVNRSGAVAERLPDGISVRRADLSVPDNVEAVTRDAEIVFLCTNPPYTEWPKLLPPLTKSVVEGVSRTKAKLVFGDNLYLYGPTGGSPIHEDLPAAATGSKGRTRAQVAAILLDAHKAGRLQVAIGRASDFYGPRVTNSVLGERVFGSILAGKSADLLGDIDLPHTYTYIRDFASALVTLSAHEEAYGQAWHVPNAKTMTTRQWMDLIGDAVGHPVKTRTLGKRMMPILALFNPMLREMKEMAYEFTEPYMVDDSKYRRAFGGEVTDPMHGIEETLEWYRRNYNA